MIKDTAAMTLAGFSRRLAGARLAPRAARWVAALGLCLGLAGAAFLAHALNQVYPIGQWLLWRYLVLWIWVSLFSVGCTAFGQLVLVRVLRLVSLPALESAVLSMIIGTVAFVMLMYAGGTVGLYRAGFAVALPLALLAVGLGSGARLARRLWHDLTTARFGALSAVAAIFGLFCVGLTYLRIVTPDALGYDAVWFHLKIAQDYARWGRIRAFPGDYSHALPHLASLLYTWGFLVPGLHVAQRWVLALHLEMCLLLWTLAGLTALVARQLQPPAPRSAWVALFLFPGLFVFGLWGTAEHVAAFFSIGIALAVLRACARPSRATFTLLAIPVAGDVLTKYQAVYVVLPALVLAGGGWVAAWIRWRRERPSDLAARRELCAAPAALLIVGVVLVAPHFLQNLIFHHNPVYPFLQRWFGHSTPSVPDGWRYFEHGMKPSAYVVKGTLFDKLSSSLRVIATPSIMPRPRATAAGSLFVLLLPALLFLRRHGALAMTSGLGIGALLLWATILPDARHLETFTPILAAATAALLIRLWRLGVLARLGIVPLVLLQIAWGADAVFCDSSRPALEASLRLAQAGLAGRGPAVFDDYRSEFVALGRAVPRDAQLVIHTFGPSLGIDRDLVMDSMGFQGLISYRSLHTPRELFDRFRSLGVTHLVHEPDGLYGSPTRQEDIVFHALVAQYGVSVGRFGGMLLTALPQTPPPPEEPYRVLCLGLGDLVDGLYPIEELRNWPRLPPQRQIIAQPERLATADNRSELLAEADAVLCPAACALSGPVADLLGSRFEVIGNRIGPSFLYLKRRRP
jgi:hypothetical protein